MHEFVSFNCHTHFPDKALISTVSSAALYGKSIFTTLAVIEGKPFLWEKHWYRLLANAEVLDIDLAGFPRDATAKALDEIIHKNAVSAGRARLTFFDGSSRALWPFEKHEKTSLLITTGEVRPPAGNFQLTVSPYPVNSRSPLAGVKSCNYLENLMAFDEARVRDFEEAIRLNERGEVTSACMANVFWLKDDRLYTPDLKTGCLPGTTREFVMENVECREVEAGIEELNEADAVFLTSAGIGVVRVGELDGRTLPEVDHPFLHLMPKAQSG